MSTIQDRMLQQLAVADWEVVRRSEENGVAMPGGVITRYTELPPDYLHFVSLFDKCVHPAGDAWFLGLPDFSGSSDAAFKWDEFERQSLEAAEGDDLWQQEIRQYWDEVLPIALSVRSGYAYLGLRLSASDFGSILMGREPEFEEARRLAPSFHDLCTIIVEHLNGREHENLADFL